METPARAPAVIATGLRATAGTKSHGHMAREGQR